VSCLTERTLAELIDNRIALGGVAGLDAHLDVCESCRQLVAYASVLATSDVEARSREGRIGRYVLLGNIGAGAMGLVYAAYDPELDRKVALKFLRTHGTVALLRQRLLGEAKAMAKVSHPNVVHVYEAGTFEDEVFVAMEYVEGETLTHWLRRDPRSVAAVLAVFREAGRGLAAAHRAGIVHRDFKPDNVLVGRDGTVKVTDFGLARAAVEASLLPAGQVSASDARASPTLACVTRSRALVGTPAYMAPEQMRGERSDARSDVFSFCVSLHEGLAGERPFAGNTLVDLAKSVEGGARGDALARRGVPKWLRRTVLRGLLARPEERHESMSALLDALDDDSRMRWRRWAIASVACVTLGVAAWRGGHRGEGPAPACTGADAKLGDVWNATQRQQAREAFLRTGLVYAPETWVKVERIVGDYAGSWRAAYADTCLATRVRAEQSEALYDLRMACLDERRRVLAALADVLRSADARVVERSIQAAMALEPVSGCGDVVSLTGPVPVPRDGASQDRAQSARAELARAQALYASGEYDDAAAAARAALADAEELGHRPTQGEVRLLLGRIEDELGDSAAAARDVEQAADDAQAGRDDLLVAKCQALLVHLVGYQLRQFEQGRAWSRRAGATLERIGDRPVIRADLENSLGGLSMGQGSYADAALHYERAFDLYERQLGRDHPRVGLIAYNVSMARLYEGNLPEGDRYARRAAEILEATLGPDHPQIGGALLALGSALTDEGDYSQAKTILERARSVLEAGLGPTHFRVANCLDSLATLRVRMGDPHGALELLTRTLVIFEAAKFDDDVVSTHDKLGEAYTAMGDWRAARRELELALDQGQKLLGAAHPIVAGVWISMGDWAAKQRRYEEANGDYGRAIAALDSASGTPARMLVPGLVGRGRALFALGRREAALADLERALAMDLEHPGPSAAAADLRATLARVLLASEPATSRALALATEARSAYGRMGMAQEVADVDALLEPRATTQRTRSR
jgi:tetratricopeptide (TPR) repeat protein